MADYGNGLVTLSGKTKNQYVSQYHLRRMAGLRNTKVTVNGNGHPMKVGFTRYGNKHLFNDTLNPRSSLLRGDLTNIPDMCIDLI